MKNKELDMVQIIEIALFFISLALFGLFYEGTIAAISLVYLILLIIRLMRSNEFVLPKNILLAGLGAIPLFALITIPFAIDRGMASFGVIKFIIVPVFILFMALEGQSFRNRLIRCIPIMAAALTLIGLVSFFTPFKDFFFINHRFSGTFQYANAYALFLLISLIITFYESYKKNLTSILVTVNFAGLLATGSRAVFVISFVSILIMLVKERRRGRELIPFIVPCACVLAVGAGVAYITGKADYFLRFLQMDIKSSSMIGRLIYDFDGLKIIASNPWGLGYKGYNFYQGSVQTANYTVTYVHNELLQTALDFGVVIAIAIAAGVILEVIRKGTRTRNRIILIAVGIHCLFDWDMQFVVMILILALISDYDKCLCLEINARARGLALGIGAVMAAVMIWLGSAGICEQFHNYKLACRIYPGLTTSQMRLVNGTDGTDYNMAEKICKHNKYCVVALQAMAEKSARLGDFVSMQKYGEMAVEAGRYNSSGYEIYIYFLSYAIDTCNSQGDMQSTYNYVCEVADVEKKINKVKKETSKYAGYIYDSSDIKIGSQYEQYIKDAQKLVENSGKE